LERDNGQTPRNLKGPLVRKLPMFFCNTERTDGMEWIRAEDAPDIIKKGQQVLFQQLNWREPHVIPFDPNYDRSSRACGGFFYMPFDWPKGPDMDHSLPLRDNPK
jgi:hypothetical protein